MQNSSPVELKLDPDGFTLNELLVLRLCLYIDVFDFCVFNVHFTDNVCY